MSAEITVNHEVIDDISFSFVEQDSSEAIRAAMIIPFSAAPILNGSIPEETPHLMEHVLCNGDGSVPSGDHDTYMDALGGSSNGSTTMTIDGLLRFETTQPDNGVDRVLRMVRGVIMPNFAQSEIDSERAIVRNELQGYLQNPSRQREMTRLHQLGAYYETDPIGLQSLDSITKNSMHDLHTSAFTRNNIRIVLTGNPKATTEASEKIATMMESLPSGNLFYSATPELLPLADYHAPAFEKPAGSSEYKYSVASKHNKLQISEYNELRIAMNALGSFMNNGERGLQAQSRNRGLSYGVRFGFEFGREQLSVSIGDSTNIAQVLPQISLFKEIIEGTEGYSLQDFDTFRRKQIGSSKLNPENALSFCRIIESNTAFGSVDQVCTPTEWTQMLADADAVQTVARVRAIGKRLCEPDFVVRYSFGENPF